MRDSDIFITCIPGLVLSSLLQEKMIHSVAGTRCDLDDKGKLENDWYFYNSSDHFPLPCLAWPHISSSCRDRLPKVSGHMEGMHILLIK